MYQPDANLLRTLSRRGCLQIGGAGLVGIHLPGLMAARQASASVQNPQAKKPKSVILILLSGGLGQHDSFDMKPEAPDGIRSDFSPIATSVPGIRICEHMPELARRADRYAIVRSMAHREGNHLVAVHHVLTGKPSFPRGASDLDRVASRDDFPCYAGVLDHERPRSDGIPNGVSLPTKLIEGPLTWPGQDAGFLGPRYDPWQLRLDPNSPESKDDSLALPEGLDSARLHLRKHLLGQTSPAVPGDSFADQQEAALALISSGKVGAALDLAKEDPRLVDRYGRHSFGRSLLMARRLVQAGVPIVQASMGIVQTWDTHTDNFGRLKNALLPPLDRAVSALFDDLQAQGLWNDTLVVMLGEFGRTPRISKLTPNDIPGRDHWPAVFSAIFAGGGVQGGQVIGKSDGMGAYPVTRTFGPPDLAATIYDALGVDTGTTLYDRLGRPLRLTEGEPIMPIYTGAAI
ncbi:DUF1501 domain-containing protein [bacterium]|nr:DUF1501 domain-containing protein [bacterium]